MTHVDAICLLERAAEELAQIHRAKHYSLWRADTVHSLGAALKQVTPFKAFADAWIFTPDGVDEFSHDRLGNWAIDRLVEKLTPASILAEFDAEVARNAASYSEIWPVIGVQLDEPVQIADGLTLEPEPKEEFASLMHRAGFQSLSLPRGTGVLCHMLTVTPAFRHGKPNIEGTGSITMPAATAREIVRQRVRLACLLSSTGPVEMPVSVLRPDRKSLVVARNAKEIQLPYAAFPPLPVPVPASAIRAAFGRLDGFRGLESLARAIDRIGRSRLAITPVDRALELGMAAEIVLMHDHSPANTEIAHKIGGRAAWLLGRDPDERKAIFTEMKQLYQARSQAVHSGALSSKTRVDLDAADRTVTQAFNAILGRGGFPDWNGLVMGDGIHLQGGTEA